MRRLISRSLATALFAVVAVADALADDSAGSIVIDAESSDISASEISVDVARDRALVTQNIYAATLHMLHERYFHRDKKVLPARAMQDIFDDIDRLTHVKTQMHRSCGREKVAALVVSIPLRLDTESVKEPTK
ncbi:MAG: hypothetical protein WBD20_06585 [Pirellulaceae bacterium]